MRRSLLVLLGACASGDRPPRTEVAIAPASTTSALPATPDAGAEDSDRLFDSKMNADKPPNNESEEDALLIEMMTPTNIHHGTPVVHVSGDTATGTTLPSPDVVACVVGAIKPLVFPQSRGSALIVDYPIVFAP